MTTASPPSFTMSPDPEKEECPYLYGGVWRQTYLTQESYRHLVAITIISLLSAVPTILLNALVIIAVATKRRLRTNSNKLLANLAGTDLLTGLVAQPLGIAVQIKRLLGVGPFCTFEKIYAVAITVVSFASLSQVMLLSIDRYIAIKHSLRYQDIVTPGRIKTAVIFNWFFAVFVTVQETTSAVIDRVSVYMNIKETLLFIILVSCIVVIIYTYRYILSETKRQKKRIQIEQLPHEEAKRMKQDHRAANTLSLILGALVFTYSMPFAASLAVLVASNSSSDNTIEPFRRVSILFAWSSTFVALGSIYNPVIYSWRNKKLRRAFLEILHYRQPQNRPENIDTSTCQTCEAFSMPVVRQEPVLLSSCDLQNAEEIIHIE